MNTVNAIETTYLDSASRTLETILLTNQKKKTEKIVYIYNYEGKHFRIFENIIEVINFFSGLPHVILKEYTKERFADAFLQKYQFIS